MAIIKVAKGGRTLNSAMEYVEKKAELVSGKDCSDSKDQALEEMKITKEMYDKTDGRQYKHYIQSFAPHETTAAQAHQIGREWANNNFNGYEVYIATHIDKEHIHNHFIVNSVNFENGKKIHLSKADLKNLKLENDRLCEREGLSIPELKYDKEFRSFDQKKYQLFKRIEQHENVKSYVVNTAIAVEKATEHATNKIEFINNMNKQGYQVSWQDNHKHVTFQDQEGNKVRLANLEKTFKEPKFSKEELEHEFTKFKEQCEIDRETGSGSDSTRTNGTSESINQGGNGERIAESKLDGVHASIREIEDRTKQFSPTGREELAKLENKQREQPTGIDPELKHIDGLKPNIERKSEHRVKDIDRSHSR